MAYHPDNIACFCFVSNSAFLSETEVVSRTYEHDPEHRTEARLTRHNDDTSSRNHEFLGLQPSAGSNPTPSTT